MDPRRHKVTKTMIMPAHRLFLLELIVLCLAQLQALSEDQKRVLLVNTEKVRLEYYVPMNRFLSDANSWSPAQGPFPVNLSDHFQKARQHLVQTRSLKGKVTLSG